MNRWSGMLETVGFPPRNLQSYGFATPAKSEKSCSYDHPQVLRSRGMGPTKQVRYAEVMIPIGPTFASCQLDQVILGLVYRLPGEPSI